MVTVNWVVVFVLPGSGNELPGGAVKVAELLVIGLLTNGFDMSLAPVVVVVPAYATDAEIVSPARTVPESWTIALG